MEAGIRQELPKLDNFIQPSCPSLEQGPKINSGIDERSLFWRGAVWED
jgi:hypothetical protein